LATRANPARRSAAGAPYTLAVQRSYLRDLGADGEAAADELAAAPAGGAGGGGSVALSLYTAAHPLYPIFTKIYSVALLLRRRCDGTLGAGGRFGLKRFIPACAAPPRETPRNPSWGLRNY
jgi:hypothetical protein